MTDIEETTQFVTESNPVGTLSQALLVFTDKSGPVYATLNPVDKWGNIEPVASSLTLAQLRKFNNTLQQIANKTATQSRVEIIPANVLYTDPHQAVTVWWRPGKPTPQFFDCEELGLVQGVCAMPSLVFAQTDKSLSVCAIRGHDRPANDTPIYHAPLFNTYDNTSVCLGDVTLEPISSFASIDRNESAFLRGINTHANGIHIKTLYPTGIYALWRDLVANPSISWNDAWLNPCNKSMGQWLKKDVL